MKILVVHDNIDFVPDNYLPPEDFGAEYDDERAVRGIMNALESNGHQVEDICFNTNFTSAVAAESPDIVFNIAEGVRGRGRESIVPALLDHMGIPYTGSDAVTLGVSLDKALTKRLAASLGVRTPNFRLITDLAELDSCSDLEFPLFLKPVAEGSSMGIRHHSLIKNSKELGKMAEWIISNYQQGCLVEEFAPGREFCVGIIGNKKPITFPVTEVKTDTDFYSFEDKSLHRKELMCPTNIPAKMEQEMVNMAISVYNELGCRDLARADFKIDSEGNPSFLEINPLPGLARRYGIYPHQAYAAGWDYEKLINHILELALKRQ